MFADFGNLGGPAPGAERLTGPVFLFPAGFAVADRRAPAVRSSTGS